MKKKSICVPAQLEWLDGALPGRIRLCAAGQESVLIENYRAVLEFTPDRVTLRAADGAYRVEGKNLTISEMRPLSLLIRGCVQRILFPSGGGE